MSLSAFPEIDRSAHMLFSADLNAACPNSVIEAMACGLPVAGFDTGALNELIVGDAGRLVPYGGDPWRLEKPDISGSGGCIGGDTPGSAPFPPRSPRRTPNAPSAWTR